MRKVVTETEVYKFDELSEEAQRHAIEKYSENLEYPWFDENLKSITAFCELYNVTLTNYSVGAFCHYSYDTNADNSNFRGLKLATVEKRKDEFLTGYCLDMALSDTFYNEFKATGNALKAFDCAIDTAFREIRADAEYQYSDEAIIENIEANNYEFTINGDIFNG